MAASSTQTTAGSTMVDNYDGDNNGGEGLTARRWGQKEMQQSNSLGQRQQGEVEGIGGAPVGVGGILSRLSSGGSEEDGGGRGEVPLTTALESSASASSPKGACSLAIGGGRC
jgi:hypothetical protein